MNAQILRSELLKLYYNKWIIVTSASLGIFIPTMAVVLNSTVQQVSFDFIANQILQSIYLGQVGFVVIAALYFGQEFSAHTLRTSLLCQSDRTKFLFAKILDLILWEAVCIILFMAISLLTIAVKYHFMMSPETILKLVKVSTPSYISIIQLSLIEAGLILLSGEMVFSLAGMISLILGLGQLLLQFSGLFRILPVLSVMNGFSTVHLSAYPSIGKGLLMQGAWCMAILIAGYLALRRKSVR